MLIFMIVSIWLGVAITVTNAFIQRLCFGSFDPYKRDWEFKASKKFFIKNDSFSADFALKKLLCFLIMLIYLLIWGFGTIYYGLYILQPNSFFIHTASKFKLPPIQFIYFSAVTMATVGYGDIFPISMWAQIMVGTQILSGPIIFSLLLLALSSGLNRTESE